jgi:hypothetical protein
MLQMCLDSSGILHTPTSFHSVETAKDFNRVYLTLLLVAVGAATS